MFRWIAYKLPDPWEPKTIGEMMFGFIFLIPLIIFAIYLITLIPAADKHDKEASERYNRINKKMRLYTLLCQPINKLKFHDFEYIDVDINKCKIIQRVIKK